MNKNLYRIIFNETRGMLMVVAEIATSACRDSSASGSRQAARRISTLSRLTFSLLISLGMVTSSVSAAVIADGQAPGHQQATILNSANGTPQVNIQTPGSGGVSRNVYSQFDVDKKGVVLNNSHANTQTQLAGMIAANPWLAKGEAKIILNEVNSRSASQLNGFIEVAGRKAQVVIANPSGITCNGCGFINAHRATLTTGQVQMNNGQLTGYDVNRGEIVIQGTGLDSSQQDSTDLIARAVKVNASIWANELKVTTGRNSVDAQHQAVSVKSTDGSVRPQFAVDVAQLGGMYANKIRLRGTEGGVGVRNAGNIGASAGDVVVNADGTLTNTGSVYAAQDLHLTSQDAIGNQGRLYAAGNTAITAKTGLNNTGLIAAAQHATVSAASIASSAQSTLAAGMAVDGTNGSSGNLTLNSMGELKAKGQNTAAGKLAARATSVDLSESQTRAESIELTATTGDISTAGGNLSATHRLTASTSKRLNNEGGKIAADQLVLNAYALSNQQGTVQQLGEQDLRLSQAGGINNRQGTIATNSKNVLLETTSLNNEQGEIVHVGDGRVDIAGGQITGSQGTLLSNGALSLGGTTLNLDGATTQAVAVSVNADSLSNRSGLLVQSGEGTLLLNVRGQTDNQNGTIASSGLLSLTANSLHNLQGKLISTGDSELTLTDFFNNRDGIVAAGGDLFSHSGAVDNTGGLLQSGSNLNLDTRGARLLNINSGEQGGIISSGNMTLKTGNLVNSSGQISANSLSVNSADITNLHGSLSAQNTLVIRGGEVNNQKGALLSDGEIHITSGEFDNTTGLIHSALNITLNAGQVLNQNTVTDGSGIQGSSITLNAVTLDNSNGALLADKGLELTLSGDLNNNAGLLSSQNSLAVQAHNISNSAGEIEAGQQITIEGKELSGDGKLLSLGDMTLNLQQDFRNTGSVQATNDLSLNIAGNVSNQALIQAGKTLLLSANNIFNSAVAEISAGTTQLTARLALTNYGLINGFNTRINGQTVTNTGSGRIYGDALAIQAGTLNNLAENGQAATIAARQRLDIGAGIINNLDHALIYSDGDLATGGALTDDWRATGQAATLNNHSSTLESAGDMALNIGTLNNINDHFSLENVLVSQEAISEYEVSRLNNGVRYNDKDYTIYIYQDEVNTLCIEGVICHTTDGDRFTHYAYTRTITEDRIKETDPGKIIAGGSLTINAGSVLNDKSQIIAGGTLSILAARLDNVEVEAFRQINDIGTATAYSRRQHSGGDSSKVKTTGYLPPTVIQGITLKPGTIEENAHGQSSNPGLPAYQTADISSHIQGADEAGTIQIVPPAGKTFEVKMNEAGSLVRVAGPTIRLPDNSLFSTHPESTSPYLVETDPRFTSQKQWLSSDFMMDAFTSNPDNVLKRLGDGYYEQKLIRDQIIALTGQRWLNGQQNDEEQYKMLMNNGIEFGSTHHLVPGVALTADQMRLLTGDMVWMVAQTVRLADGSTQQVLVPQLYAVVKEGDLDGSGALLAGNNLSLTLSGDLTNSGRISGRQNTQIQADNLSNTGQILGGDVALKAQTDINNIGGLIAGNNSLLASAGRDINAATTTRSAESNEGRFVRNTIDRVAGFYVEQPDGRLVLQADRDISLTAAQVINGGENGQTTLSVGRDLNLTTVTTASRDNLNWGSDWLHQSATQQTGSEVLGNGSVAMIAGHDVNVTAGAVSAAEQLNVTAGNNITVQHAIDTETFDQHYKATGSSSIASKTTVESRDTFSHQIVNGSQLDGESVNLRAGHDLNITGSSVAGTRDVNLAAGNNLNIQAATTQNEETHFYSEKKSGLSGTGGIGVTAGSSSLKTTDDAVSLTSTGSTVGSTQGNVNLNAGSTLTVQGSDVLAGKDIGLSGREVNILAAENQSSQTHKTEQKQGGLTLALSGTAGSALNAAVTTAKAASEESDGRLAALQGVKAALSGAGATQAARLDAAKGDDPDNNATLGFSLSYGSQSSKSESRLEQTSQQGSSLMAGGTLSIIASGNGVKGENGDINVQGSQLQAGKEMLLSANRDVNLVSAEESSQTRGTDSSKGGSVGVGVTAGSGGTGFNVSASINKGKGHENADSVSHRETTLNAGNQVTITSGRDATLTGAQVNGETVKMDVARNLTLASEQDRETYDSKQQNVSAGAGYTLGAGTATASVNASRDKMNSDWQSVTEQTGIFAGKGGFDITVGEHTRLDGAVISSTAEADKNRLDTGTLGWRDIHNEAAYSVEHAGAGISTGGSIGSQFEGNMAGNILAGVNGSDSASSTTHSAVSEGTIVIRNEANQHQEVAQLSHDVENTNPGLEVIFDKEKEQNRLKAAQLVAEIGAQAMDIARTEGQIAGEKAKRDPAALQAAKEALAGKGNLTPTEKQIAEQAYNTAMAPYGTGSALQQGMQAATAVIQGLAGGDLAKAAAGGAAPYIANIIGSSGLDDAGKIMAHAAVNAALAAAQGNSALAGAAGAATAEMAGMIALEVYGKSAGQLTETEKQTVSALATLAAGLAGGLAGDSTADAVAGAQAGKTTVDNNALSDLTDALAAGKTPQKVAEERVEAENERYKKENCAGMSAEACSVKMYTQRREELKDIGSFGADFVPVVGDIKGFAEAESAIDYLAAAIGLIPGAGDAAGKIIKAAETALKKGDVAEASRLINKASDEIKVKALDVGSYKELKAREVVGDNLEHDHIPSFAALKKSKEIELGRPLTDAETKNLYQNATAVEVPKDVHQAGPTYGGKNTSSQVEQDAINLCGAECRDTDSLRKNMLERGYDPELVDDAIQQIKERNRQIGVTK